MGHLELLVGLIIIGVVIYGTGYMTNGLIENGKKNYLPELFIIGMIILLHFIVSVEFYCLSNVKSLTNVLSNLIIWEFNIVLMSFGILIVTTDIKISDGEFKLTSSALYFFLIVTTIVFAMGLCLKKIIFG